MQNLKIVARVNHLLLARIARQGDIVSFCYFLKFKYTFRDSRLHEANLSKLSRLTNLNVKTVRCHIDRCLDLGWVRKVGHHYLFCSLDELWKNAKISHELRPDQRFSDDRIEFSKIDTVYQIREKIALLLIQKNVKHQTFVSKAKSDSWALNGLKDWRKKERTLRKLTYCGLSRYDILNEFESEGYDKVSISVRRIGRMIGLKKSSGSRIKSQLVVRGAIVAQKNIQEIEFSTEWHTSPLQWRLVRARLPKNCYYNYKLRKILIRKADLIYISIYK